MKPIIGVGLDESGDGVKRVTRTDNAILIGGSKESHERMQETAIKIEEALEKRGKTMKEVSRREAFDIIHEAQERTGR